MSTGIFATKTPGPVPAYSVHNLLEMFFKSHDSRVWIKGVPIALSNHSDPVDITKPLLNSRSFDIATREVYFEPNDYKPPGLVYCFEIQKGRGDLETAMATPVLLGFDPKPMISTPPDYFGGTTMKVSMDEEIIIRAFGTSTDGSGYIQHFTTSQAYVRHHKPMFDGSMPRIIWKQVAPSYLFDTQTRLRRVG